MGLRPPKKCLVCTWGANFPLLHRHLPRPGQRGQWRRLHRQKGYGCPLHTRWADPMTPACLYPIAAAALAVPGCNGSLHYEETIFRQWKALEYDPLALDLYEPKLDMLLCTSGYAHTRYAHHSVAFPVRPYAKMPVNVSCSHYILIT